jgi:hypothetical protein
MPNWCFNEAKFSHEDPTMMVRLMGAVRREIDQNHVSFFHEFVPGGEVFDEDWCVDNWGTTLARQIYIVNEDTLSFETAWNPPVAFYHKMVALGFYVKAMFYEDGNELLGSFFDGVTDYYEYDTPAARDGIPYDILQYLFDVGFDVPDDDSIDEPRVVRYLGREAAYQAYIGKPLDDAVCLICLTVKAEMEQKLSVDTKEDVIKKVFVVPRCGTDIPHLYHRTCLKTWLKQPDNNKCPTCMNDIAGEACGTPQPDSQISSLATGHSQVSSME